MGLLRLSQKPSDMPFRARHRRWIALIALIGLLFQQVAMATYACPLLARDSGTISKTADLPPCHSPNSPDKARCHEHCHPLAQSADHSPLLSVPPATVPAATWFRAPRTRDVAHDIAEFAVDARAAAPPLIIQHCTFLI
jgi:hypothetical protein